MAVKPETWSWSLWFSFIVVWLLVVTLPAWILR